MNTRRTPLLAGLACLALTAVACGDDDPAPTEAPLSTEAMMEAPLSTEAVDG